MAKSSTESTPGAGPGTIWKERLAADHAAAVARQPAGVSHESALPGGAVGPGSLRVSYSDRLVEPDGTVERRYASGVTERQFLVGPGQIGWTDDRGGSGTDYNLVGGQILRRAATGGSAQGRQLGFGITCWNDEARVTVNETPLPERPPEIPPPSLIGRCAAGLSLGRVFGVGAIRAGRRRIRPESSEFPFYAEQAMIRRWIEARRASGAPYVQTDPYFSVYTPPYPRDTTPGTGGNGGGDGSGAAGDAGGGA
jgi:hypothetical protein